MKKQIMLKAKRVKYHSPKDEDAFFEWLGKIPSITSIGGIGDELHLQLSSNRIPNSDLRELIAVFYRYKIDLKQLTVFLNSKNKKWLMGEPKVYWYKKMFGDKVKNNA